MDDMVVKEAMLLSHLLFASATEIKPVGFENPTIT